MYIRQQDATTFNAREGPRAAVAANAVPEADHAMAYTKKLFKRLTGHPAAHPRDRAPWMAATEAGHATAYAKETFARMKGHRLDHADVGDYGLDYGHTGGDRVAGRGRKADGDVHHATAYARDVFTRLRGIPAGPPQGDNAAPTRDTEAGIVDPDAWVAHSIRRAVARLARRFGYWLLPPYLRGRRRRIAIAQLRALPDRVLADIGLARGDIEATVDRLLARGDDTLPRPAGRPPPDEKRRHDRPLAA
jgi:uncharacterized protein YjiS (DUF1127 family)